MNRTFFLPLALIATANLAACLESGRNAASDTLGSDTVTSDTFTSDTVDPCAGKSCDDSDPCTYDQCDPTSGECLHYQVPAGAMRRASCSDDIQCDDGDPCTADICVQSGDGCGIQWAYCDHQVVPGCYGCNVTGCDDGDPCTVDICLSDGTCNHPLAENCDYACNGTHLTPIANAAGGSSAGVPVKVAGWVGTDPYSACLDGQCQCTGSPTVADGNAMLRLLPPISQVTNAPSWSCSYDYCSNDPGTCDPLVYGAGYWVWGTAVDAYEPFAGDGAAVPVAPMIGNLRAIDYCLQTNAAGLVGSYTGTLSAPLLNNVANALEGQIFVGANGQLMLTLGEPFCPTCGATQISGLFPQTVPVTAGDGWISFAIAAPVSCAAALPNPVAKLMSQRNTLAGDYHDQLVGGPGDVAYCSYGAISLTRVP